MKEKPLTTREAIELIKVLTKLIELQKGLVFADEDLVLAAGEKINELLPLVKIDEGFSDK